MASEVFETEKEFEEAVVELLQKNGWTEVLKYPTEEALRKNWAKFLYDNNREKDRLNDYPLTDTEVQQLVDYVASKKTPLLINEIINGKEITLKRDNPDDKDHFNKNITLHIFDRNEICGGKSVYQIAQQPQYKSIDPYYKNRRGDLCLLINGMPLIHIELKKSGIPLSQAYGQIEKYSSEGVFTGFFSFVQIFVAMIPDETVYFANPGSNGKFNPMFYFHWADFNNKKDFERTSIDNWKSICRTLLHIPLAHQLIGFYTIADKNDQILKVMRSYQVHAANAICDRVSKIKQSGFNTQLGGYVWHTTGSGKTLTSFKTAQLIINSGDVNKVVFLMDRIELGTQSFSEYKGFATEDIEIQSTENTGVLISKLKSPYDKDGIIVTSIQKMSRIKDEDDGRNQADIEIINKKKIVFIIDEAHRSTFGEMLTSIKNTFSTAIFFGFTGTPIFNENAKIGKSVDENSLSVTTADVFGNELSRYTIADGIEDNNVLGFDTYKVCTFPDDEIRQTVALYKAKANTIEEAYATAEKQHIFEDWMDSKRHPMGSFIAENNEYVKGIEAELPNSQYTGNLEHHTAVVNDILGKWDRFSKSGKLHAIFATTSITEAIDYYRLFKEKIKKNNKKINITALFDPNEGNDPDKSIAKEKGIKEILTDYNNMYFEGHPTYTHENHAEFKKDLSNRLAHKKPYNDIANDKTQQLDLLIVVDQMLTGYDSKWVNVLYLDKEMEYENIIQAFSRTNRLFDKDLKPFGVIKYYRRPHTMENSVRRAVKTYSGDRPFGLFVAKLNDNLVNMINKFEEIKKIFKEDASEGNESIDEKNIFSKLPKDDAEKKQFVKLFNEYNKYLSAAKVQGFSWKQSEYAFDANGQEQQDAYNFTSEKVESEIPQTITVPFDKVTHDSLVQRYKEVAKRGSVEVELHSAFDIDSSIIEINTDRIDADYMNNRFTKFYKNLTNNVSKEIYDESLDELHKTFSTLTQDEQKYAIMLLNDITRGELKDLDPNKSFRDYLTEYSSFGKNKQISDFAKLFNLDEEKLKAIMKDAVTPSNIDANGRLQELERTADINKAISYFETKTQKKLSMFSVRAPLDSLIRNFILAGGFDEY